MFNRHVYFIVFFSFQLFHFLVCVDVFLFFLYHLLFHSGFSESIKTMGTSCSTTVRVKNEFGHTLDYVTVSHKFRRDGYVESRTWNNVENNELTQANFRVNYKVGLGALTDYDWWKVDFLVMDWIDPYFERNGFKECYLEKDDQYGPVTICIKWNKYDGMYIHIYNCCFCCIVFKIFIVT
ncbi:hypothetical protein RFI_16542 [Reticulomyxa filosa]|uniref:Up-regulated in Daf-2 domain-containing protein n=1 Tax=Reticulomyxa filosa TaxID=46433 RepID=X6N3L7_RETFI|nr:hypothetical protein RFI_16542 [Reticulomyxa filosa]|eukprot:ETO20676.1 hypothetical protein RFI_16542 [Reticulomyxa filosa]